MSFESVRLCQILFFDWSFSVSYYLSFTSPGQTYTSQTHYLPTEFFFTSCRIYNRRQIKISTVRISLFGIMLLFSLSIRAGVALHITLVKEGEETLHIKYVCKRRNKYESKIVCA